MSWRTRKRGTGKQRGLRFKSTDGKEKTVAKMLADRTLYCPLCGKFIWQGEEITKIRIPGTMFGPYTAHVKCYEDYKKEHPYFA